MGYHVDTKTLPSSPLIEEAPCLSKTQKRYLQQQIANDKETSINLFEYLFNMYDELRDIQYHIISDSSTKNMREQLDELLNTVKDTGLNLYNHIKAHLIGSHKQSDKTINKKEDSNMENESIEKENTHSNSSDGKCHMPAPYRAQILDKAKECVSGQRVQDYGTPEDNFGDIASAWNWYLRDHLKTDLLPRDVALMMTLMKVARAKNGGGSGDSFVDIAGYAACCAEIDHNAKEA